MPNIKLPIHTPKLNVMKKVIIQALLLACGCANVAAENLNFSFQNPSFLGGNPNNAAGLLNQANAQNPYKAPVDTPYEKFQKSLENAIFSRVQSTLLDARFGKITADAAVGDFDTENYIINITKSDADTLVVTTTDKTTGAVTTFTVDTKL